MELRRILARDLRAATEKAVALYGKEALVISHEQVNGQTEVIVAVDLEADPIAMRLADREAMPAIAEAARVEPSFAPLNFGEVLHRELQEIDMAMPDERAEPELRAHVEVEPIRLAHEPEADRGRDQIRAREIVDLVRQEMAILRRDLRLSQSVGGFGAPMLGGLAAQFDQALQADHAPIGLRMLITDHIQSANNSQMALAQIEELLNGSMGSAVHEGPLAGIHVVMGPSGAGKTTTVTKLAAEAAQALGSDQVAVLSWCDTRLGAWAQIQMGCAKLGVDCFRAQETSLLLPLLEELRGRACVIIDTPGIEMARHRARLEELIPEAIFHLALPLDAASHQVEGLLKKHAWSSLMVTKVDEAVHGWGLIAALCQRPMALYPFTGGQADGTGRQAFGTGPLARMAVDHLAKELAHQAKQAENDRMGEATAQLAQAAQTVLQAGRASL
jgi:flagellar biosynthesis protein FlhF